MFLHNSAQHHENSIAHGNYMNKFVQRIQNSKTKYCKAPYITFATTLTNIQQKCLGKVSQSVVITSKAAL